MDKAKETTETGNVALLPTRPPSPPVSSDSRPSDQIQLATPPTAPTSTPGSSDIKVGGITPVSGTPQTTTSADSGAGPSPFGKTVDRGANYDRFVQQQQQQQQQNVQPLQLQQQHFSMSSTSELRTAQLVLCSMIIILLATANESELTLLILVSIIFAYLIMRGVLLAFNLIDHLPKVACGVVEGLLCVIMAVLSLMILISNRTRKIVIDTSKNAPPLARQLQRESYHVDQVYIAVVFCLVLVLTHAITAYDLLNSRVPFNPIAPNHPTDSKRHNV